MNVVTPIEVQAIEATAKNAGAARMSPFSWGDALLFDEQLTEDGRMVRDAARDFCQSKLTPRILKANRHERFGREIMNEFGETGFLGAILDSHGRAHTGLNASG